MTDRLEARLRADPSLTTPLATEHVAIDFDRAPYLATLEAANRPRPLTASVLARVDKFEAEHVTCWASLAEKNIERRDLDDTLELHRAYNGLSWGWAGTPAAQLLFDDGGLQLGDDAGYGPARLLSNNDVSSAMAAIERIDIATFAARYREGYAAAPGDSQTATLLAEYEDFAHVMPAFQRLVTYLREARIGSRALLVWFE